MVRAAAPHARAVVGRRRSTSTSARATGCSRRTPAPLEGRVLFLDTRPLHAMLMQNVVMLEQKIKAQPLSDATPQRSEQLDLLTKLASQVDPEFKPFARRGERTAAAGAVDAIVGFAKISGYLRDEERDADPAHRAPARASAARWSSRCSAASRNEADRRRRARAAALRHVRGAGRAVGSQGRQRRPASGWSRR